MKKVFFYVALSASVILSSCHKKAGVPEAVQNVVAQLEESISNEEEDESMALKEVKVEGEDIVCIMEVDESEFGGMSFKEAFEKVGYDEEALSQAMKESMFEDMDEDLVSQIAVLREYKYNLVFRYVGSESKEEMNAKVLYEDLPEVE